MARRDKTRDERLSIHINPLRDMDADAIECNRDAINRLETLLQEYIQANFVGPLSPKQWYEREYEIARIAQRHSTALTIWARFQNKNLTDSAHDPEEFADYFNDKNAEVKLHATALLDLLRDNSCPPAISSVIGETRQGYFQPDGHPAFRTLERSLPARLSELIAAIEIPTKSQKRPNNGKGKHAAREGGIRAILHMWLEVGGRDFRLQRKSAGESKSAGKSCGSFDEFARKALAAFNIKHSDLEAFVLVAEELLKSMPESQREFLRNQYRVTYQ